MANRRLRFFRIDPETGARIPRIMILDQSLTFVDEIADDVSQSAPPRSTPETPARQNQHLVARWVTRSVRENPIEGTDELRAEYFKDLASMQQKAESEGADCSACDISKLIGLYRAKLKALGKLPE